MKFLIVLLAAVSLTACGGKNDGDKNTALEDARTKAQAICPNPISVEVKQDEKQIQLVDLVTGADDSWELASANLYIERVKGQSDVSVLNGLEVAGGEATVICHSAPKVVAPETNLIEGNTASLLSIDAKTGSSSQTKITSYKAENDAAESRTTIEDKEDTVKVDPATLNTPTTKVVVVKKADGSVVIRALHVDASEGVYETQYVETTYRLKSAPALAPAPTPDMSDANPDDVAASGDTSFLAPEL